MLQNPEGEEALQAALDHYPEKEIVGASRDMRRYAWAQDELVKQGKGRLQTWPSNKTRCPQMQADVARIKAQIPIKYLPKKPESIARVMFSPDAK